MSGITDRTALYAVKKALYDRAVTVFAGTAPELEQIWGKARRRPDKYVEWFGGESRQETGPYGPNRSRDETVKVRSMWQCLIRGDVDAAREAEDYLYARIGELERHVRMERPMLGGAARHCFISEIVIEESVAESNANFLGHIAIAAVEFEAKVRITG